MLWQLHKSFESEFQKASKKIRNLEDGLNAAKRLLEVQFDPLDPKTTISPGKIHRVHSDTIWELWKLEMVIPGSGLRPNQSPRVWFVITGDTIIFLSIGLHTKNYDDNAKNRIAMDRFNEIA